MSKKKELAETLYSIFWFGVGLFIIFSSELIILKCHRLQLNQKVACEVTHFTLGRKHIDLIPVGEIQGAKIQRWGKRNYRVILLTINGQIPIQDILSGSSQKFASQTADQINSFLKEPEQRSLKIHQHPNWFAVFWGVISISLPILLLVFKLLDFRDRKSNIRKIQREVSSLDYEDKKSDIS